MNCLYNIDLVDEEGEQIAMSTSQYRGLRSIAIDKKKKDDIQKVVKLKNKGHSNTEIARELGMPESTVRNYLKIAALINQGRNQNDE